MYNTFNHPHFRSWLSSILYMYSTFKHPHFCWRFKDKKLAAHFGPSWTVLTGREIDESDGYPPSLPHRSWMCDASKTLRIHGYIYIYIYISTNYTKSICGYPTPTIISTPWAQVPQLLPLIPRTQRSMYRTTFRPRPQYSWATQRTAKSAKDFMGFIRISGDAYYNMDL